MASDNAEDRPLKLPMRMHRDRAGQCWADSALLPGYTAAGGDFAAVMDLVTEALVSGILLGALSREAVDLRWQWCDDPGRGIAAWREVKTRGDIAIHSSGQDVPCPCASASTGHR